MITLMNPSPRAASVPGLSCSQMSALEEVSRSSGSTTIIGTPADHASIRCTALWGQLLVGFAPQTRIQAVLEKSGHSAAEPPRTIPPAERRGRAHWAQPVEVHCFPQALANRIR